MSDLHDIAARLRAAGLPERAAQIEALGLDLAIEAPVVAALAGLVGEIEALRADRDRWIERTRATRDDFVVERNRADAHEVEIEALLRRVERLSARGRA